MFVFNLRDLIFIILFGLVVVAIVVGIILSTIADLGEKLQRKINRVNEQEDSESEHV